ANFGTQDTKPQSGCERTYRGHKANPWFEGPVMSPSKLLIGSRGSPLALAQSKGVKAELERHHPHLEVEIVIIKTWGDVFSQAPLSQIGGKGLFTKEIEESLLRKKIDLAVHS